MINDLLMDCVTILRENEDHDVAFNKLLGTVASFYSADRSYIFEFDLETQKMSNTYEWCAEGIEAEIGLLQNLDISIVDRWIKQFEAHGEFYINSLDGDLDHDSDEYKILAMQNIQSLMAAPLRLGGDIVGFLGVDNPRANTNILLVLQAVSSFAVNQLGRQREEKRRMMLSALTDDYDVLLRSDLDNDTLAVLRASERFAALCPKLYTYRSLSAFLEWLCRPDEEERASFAARINRASILQHLTQEHELYHNFLLADEEGADVNYQIKVVPLGSWPESHQILFGIHNIEKTVRAEEMQRKMLKEALDKAEYASHAKTVFLSNMSHDIRTPMNAIIGYTTLAKRLSDITPACREFLDKIEASSEHLLALINDVLEMSRIESAKMELEPEPCDLKKVLGEVRSLFATQMVTKRIAFTVSAAGVRNSRVLCDKNRLDRVLLNLLSNAYKFTPDGGTISVTLRQTGSSAGNGSYELRVRDSGMGMSAEFAARIFDAYSRERTASKIQGTGLGMAITKNIVDLMGGSIELQTAPGKGTEFIIRLSFPLAEKEKEAAADQPAEAWSVSEQDFSKIRLLLVDDNEINREIATMILEEAGFRLDTAENGKMACDIIAASHPGDYQAVLMDIQMPVMDGYEATKVIRSLSDPALAGIPIIAMTANAFAEDIRAAKDAGMDGHIAKPIDLQKMIETLTEVLVSNASLHQN